MAEDNETDKTEETFELLNVEEEQEEVLDITTPPKTRVGEKEDDEEDDEKKEREEEEVDELKELEDELKGPSEEDLELMTPVRRREILAKYPQLFKDFPYLEKAYYREQQFTEIFPTIDDARTSVEKSKAMDSIERDVMDGNIASILNAAKNENQEAFLKIADNYLPALRAVDQQAYFHVLGNVIKDTIITMVKEGNELGEQGAPLKAAANILNQFIFGSQKFTPAQPLSRQSKPEENERVEQQRQQEHNRVMSQFTSVRDDLQTRADNVLKSTISENIDPHKTMTDYVKRTAVREAHEKLEDLMSKDTRFRGLLDKLWEKAFEKGFDKESTDRIKSAYLSKARTLLPSVIKKARNDALKGLGRRVREDEDEEPASEKRGPVTPGRSTPQSSGKFKKPSDIPKNMSTLDVLMKD